MQYRALMSGLTGLCSIASWLASPVVASAQEPADNDKPCFTYKGDAEEVAYNPQYIFSRAHACYPGAANECPAKGSLCAHHARVKLGNYDTTRYQDVLYSPHRGIWGSTYGSKDPAFTLPPAQNTIEALNLVTSYATEFPKNVDGDDYGAMLSERLVEIDITNYGDLTKDDNGVILSHYVTSANTNIGSLNQYLVNMTSDDIAAYKGYMERRDFSPSKELLSELTLDNVTRQAIMDADAPDETGNIVFLDIKIFTGKIPCQNGSIHPGMDNYDIIYARNGCAYGEEEKKATQKNRTDLQSAQEIYNAGGKKNIVIKTASWYSDVVAAAEEFYDVDEQDAVQQMKKFLWQPHPSTKTPTKDPSYKIQQKVQYIHDWLVNVPKAVEAWEISMISDMDSNTMRFCVTEYIPPDSSGEDYPYGQVVTRLVGSMKDNAGCLNGPYQNILDYIRVNTGNPNYFGFTDTQKSQNLYSGNRANMWILTTASPVGTSDRFYRWQMLGMEPTYYRADPVYMLNIPYAAYAIWTADRLDAMYQAVEKGIFPKWSPNGPVDGD